jgi:hypothetical protein
MGVGPSQSLLNFVAASHEAYMLDKVYILRYTNAGTTNDLGTPDITYPPDGTPTVCSFDDKRAKEELQTAQVKKTDSVVRFPNSTTVSELDRIELIERMGRTIEPPIQYAIDGDIERGPFGTVCPLKLLTGVDNA